MSGNTSREKRDVRKRRERLAAELRANLKRRKDKSREAKKTGESAAAGEGNREDR